MVPRLSVSNTRGLLKKVELLFAACCDGDSELPPPSLAPVSRLVRVINLPRSFTLDDAMLMFRLYAYPLDVLENVWMDPAVPGSANFSFKDVTRASEFYCVGLPELKSLAGIDCEFLFQESATIGDPWPLLVPYSKA